MGTIEKRKRDEQTFHDTLRALTPSAPEYAFLTGNLKFYAVAERSQRFFRRWLKERCPGKRVLDFGCGDGAYALFCAEHHAQVVGIDISEVSVRKAREEARVRGLADRAAFLVMDAEDLAFAPGSFDVIYVAGVLHHLDLSRAIRECAHVLKPTGELIFAEPLVHNPVFQWYRRRTPHLRTTWEVEHLLGRRDLQLLASHFSVVDFRFFHLATLLAVPFRSTRLFRPLLFILERLDALLLRLPGIRWLAWQVLVTMRSPQPGELAGGAAATPADPASVVS